MATCVASNEAYTHLFVHPKRGQDALLSSQSIFGNCLNWTVHDCWVSYFTVGKGRHALCGAHLLRELAALVEQGSRWAKALHSYLLEAYKASRPGPILAPERIHWQQCYEQLCEQANEEELPPLVFFKANGQTGRAKRSKGRNLLDRLIRHQDAVLAFAFEPGVPFTNNQAERDRSGGPAAARKGETAGKRLLSYRRRSGGVCPYFGVCLYHEKERSERGQ